MNKVEVISSSPLFEMLSKAERIYLSDLVKPLSFEAGQSIFEEGEIGDSLYVVEAGEVEVIRRNDQGQYQVLATIGPREFFGEMSLIDKEFRSATVRAKTQCRLLHLTAENLMLFRKEFRDGFTYIVINIARVLSARLREANARR